MKTLTIKLVSVGAVLLSGYVMIQVVIGGMSAWSSVEESSAVDDACAHLRKLSQKTLDTCEDDLVKTPHPGNYQLAKLQCLKELKTLKHYPRCDAYEHLDVHYLKKNKK